MAFSSHLKSKCIKSLSHIICVFFRIEQSLQLVALILLISNDKSNLVWHNYTTKSNKWLKEEFIRTLPIKIMIINDLSFGCMKNSLIFMYGIVMNHGEMQQPQSQSQHCDFMIQVQRSKGEGTRKVCIWAKWPIRPEVIPFSVAWSK